MSYRVRAHNTATASTNRIHDDEVARRFGFRGGLVPGVDVYAYLAHVPVQRWGLDWLARGTAEARFAAPVYDGEEVRVESTEVDARTLDLAVVGPDGGVRATGRATLPAVVDPADVPDPATFPDHAPPDDPPPAVAEVWRDARFGAVRVDGSVDAAGRYLDDVREHHPLFRVDGWAHPGWLLRQANSVLMANVTLGPWIHVASRVRHLAPVRADARVETRAIVVGVDERGGHHFVELDVCSLADGRPVSRVAHTAIWRPRGLG